MNLNNEFLKHGYKNLLDYEDSDCEIVKLEDFFDNDKKPQELLGIYMSKQKDELFIVLNGDLMKITELCDRWDDRIRVFTIINGNSLEIHKLKYNIVQLIICSKAVQDKKIEGNLNISRKLIIKGHNNNSNIIIDDNEEIELPFYMIKPGEFNANEELINELDQLMPKDKKVLDILKEDHRKKISDENGQKNRYFETNDFNLIEEWLKG